MRETFGFVRVKMLRASRDQGRYYNPCRREWRPTLRFAVLARTHRLSNAGEGFAAKLGAKYEEGEKKSKVANVAQQRRRGHPNGEGKPPGRALVVSPPEDDPMAVSLPFVVVSGTSDQRK
ncbi:hypothetical protein KR222_000020, partial [Zaprionus bogoriensis]